MPAAFFYFDSDYAVNVHDWVIENSGGLPGSNNLGLLESTLEHIKNDLYYPKIQDKLTHLVLRSSNSMPLRMEISVLVLHWDLTF